MTIAGLSVFERTLAQKGESVNPGVIGSVTESGNNFGATGIDSIAGVGNDDADIPANETLEGAEKTLGCALGISAERINTRISGGKIIEVALS